MSGVSLLATLGTHAHARGVRLRLARFLPALPVPVVSVGTLAFGGRAKTPLVAALAARAVAEGLRPAVLTRGHGRRSRALHVAVGEGGDAPWLAAVSVAGERRRGWQWASTLGDEPAWLAGTLRGVPIGVSADRRAAAVRVLAEHRVDFLLLDDGFQHPLPRCFDLVVVAPGDGSPGRWAREAGSALLRADHVVELGAAGGLLRRPGLLRDLSTGTPVQPPPRARILCGVGDPGSVAATAGAAGIAVVDAQDLGDHRGPSRGRRGRLVADPAAPWLVTEKDAVGWAAAHPPPGPTRVLALELLGVDPLWARCRAAVLGA